MPNYLFLFGCFLLSANDFGVPTTEWLCPASILKLGHYYTKRQQNPSSNTIPITRI